jgi:hypothetical protein
MADEGHPQQGGIPSDALKVPHSYMLHGDVMRP